jgi:hypothetical protein
MYGHEPGGGLLGGGHPPTISHERRGPQPYDRPDRKRARRSGVARREDRYPNLWLDEKVDKVRDGARVMRKGLVVAHVVHETRRREVIGLDAGDDADTEAF